MDFVVTCLLLSYNVRPIIGVEAEKKPQMPSLHQFDGICTGVMETEYHGRSVLIKTILVSVRVSYIQLTFSANLDYLDEKLG